MFNKKYLLIIITICIHTTLLAQKPRLDSTILNKNFYKAQRVINSKFIGEVEMIEKIELRRPSREITIQEIGITEKMNATPVDEFDKFAKLDKLQFDFGKISNTKKAKVDFIITNISDAPLVIDDVKTSCGCLLPIWSVVPIMPHSSATISFFFNTIDRTGYFLKTATIYARNEVKTITIKGIINE